MEERYLISVLLILKEEINIPRFYYSGPCGVVVWTNLKFNIPSDRDIRQAKPKPQNLYVSYVPTVSAET